MLSYYISTVHIYIAPPKYHSIHVLPLTLPSISQHCITKHCTAGMLTTTTRRPSVTSARSAAGSLLMPSSTRATSLSAGTLYVLLSHGFIPPTRVLFSLPYDILGFYSLFSVIIVGFSLTSMYSTLVSTIYSMDVDKNYSPSF